MVEETQEFQMIAHEVKSEGINIEDTLLVTAIIRVEEKEEASQNALCTQNGSNNFVTKVNSLGSHNMSNSAKLKPKKKFFKIKKNPFPYKKGNFTQKNTPFPRVAQTSNEACFVCGKLAMLLKIVDSGNVGLLHKPT
ncbi:putative Homogentisate 1,2-dioxygenase [Sesbania bispinosa]|nr:putative Homogentisate 1,2-dioxygenase [Sesbania bispinosa]